MTADCRLPSGLNRIAHNVCINGVISNVVILAGPHHLPGISVSGARNSATKHSNKNKTEKNGNFKPGGWLHSRSQEEEKNQKKKEGNR